MVYVHQFAPTAHFATPFNKFCFVSYPAPIISDYSTQMELAGSNYLNSRRPHNSTCRFIHLATFGLIIIMQAANFGMTFPNATQLQTVLVKP